MRIFWKSPSSQRLVRADKTRATTVSSTSATVSRVEMQRDGLTREGLDHQGQNILFQASTSGTGSDVDDALEKGKSE